MAMIISPVLGNVVILIAIFLSRIIKSSYMEGGHKGFLGDEIFYFFIFPVIFVILLIFQFIVLEPVFRNLKRKNKLNNAMMQRMTLIVVFGVSLIFLLLYGNIEGGYIIDYLSVFVVMFIICSFYFVPNMMTYYLIYVKHLGQGEETKKPPTIKD